MRITGIYGKGFGTVGGTSPNVTRLSIFTAAMTVCDPSLEGHASRVGVHAEALARRLGWTDTALEELRLGAALHDVGKVNVRPDVLNKPGRLDDDELAEVRTHPIEGAWLIASVPSLSPALPYVLFHHERWDGSGYPTRRAGLDIPLEGRLLAVADSFDAMTTARPYCDARAFDGAIAEVERCSGSQFDPAIADAFVAAYAAGEIVAAEPLSVAV
jgi:HD-GYP domain-containing protein (c-di-GMP phosphodiesterase class II)